MSIRCVFCANAWLLIITTKGPERDRDNEANFFFPQAYMYADASWISPGQLK